MTKASTTLRNEETQSRDDRKFCEGFFWECGQALCRRAPLGLRTIYSQIQYIRVFLVPGFFGYMRVLVLCAPPNDLGIFKTLSRAKSDDVGAC